MDNHVPVVSRSSSGYKSLTGEDIRQFELIQRRVHYYYPTDIEFRNRININDMNQRRSLPLPVQEALDDLLLRQLNNFQPQKHHRLEIWFYPNGKYWPKWVRICQYPFRCTCGTGFGQGLNIG